jgi:hypothetical protein
MQLLIDILAVLLAGIAVVLLPGACLLAVWGLDAIVAPPLVPAAALALGLLPLGIATSATLLLHAPIIVVFAIQLVLVLSCWGTLTRRVRQEHRPGRASSRLVRARVLARGLLEPIGNVVCGTWLRGTPVLALLVALAGGVLALLMGYYAWNDSLYHIGQAQKLLHLGAPTFSNTLQFTDGSAHPGYLIPVWHEAIALTSFVAHVDPVLTAWVLPALTFPIGLLAFGGLAWTLARSRAAAPAGCAALLVTVLAGVPFSDALVNAMHPGTIALGVLAPLALSLILTALWPSDVRELHALSARTSSRAATFLAMVAVAGIGVLHVGYLWVFGFGVLGYYVVWALRAPWPRAVVRRHLVTGAAIALVAAVCLGCLLPGLTRLEGLGRDAQQELMANDSAGYEGENGADLEALLRGNPDGAFHLRADYLVLAGGLALLGLVVVPIVLLAPRWPGGWYLAGASTLTLGIALSDELFPRFVKVVTLDQARRIERVLPLTSALALGALAVAAAATLLWARRERVHRVAAGVLVAAATIGVYLAVEGLDPLDGYGGARIVQPRVLTAVLVVLLLGLVAYGIAMALGFVHRGDAARERLPRPLQSWTWPTELLAPVAGTLATLILLVGAIPVYGNVGKLVDSGRLEQLPSTMRTAEMRLFAPNVARELRKLPAGSKVLADPRTRYPYIAMAVAPVYVVSSVPRHTALTPENRVQERFERAVSFFDGGLGTDGGLTLDQRIQLLRDEHVDAVLVHPFAAAPIRRRLEHMSGVRLVARGNQQELFLVDRSKLPR